MRIIYLLGVWFVIVCHVSCENSVTQPIAEKPYVELLTPGTNDVFYVGDTIYISWEYKHCDSILDDVFSFFTYIEMSTNGKNYNKDLFYKSVIHKSEMADTFWIVPEDSTYFAENVVIKINEYSLKTILDVSEAFAIRKKILK